MARPRRTGLLAKVAWIWIDWKSRVTREPARNSSTLNDWRVSDFDTSRSKRGQNSLWGPESIKWARWMAENLLMRYILYRLIWTVWFYDQQTEDCRVDRPEAIWVFPFDWTEQIWDRIQIDRLKATKSLAQVNETIKQKYYLFPLPAELSISNPNSWMLFLVDVSIRPSVSNSRGWRLVFCLGVLHQRSFH